MKKFSFVLLLFFLLGLNSKVFAHHCYTYVTYKDYYQEEHNFHNCDRHSLLKETTVYFYSNGARRSYITYTIFNKDGSILFSNCSNIRHLVYNNKHYFTFYKNKKYQIADEFGNYLSTKNYKMMDEIFPNKLLVKLNKKFGIIDLKENIIVPIKYSKFDNIGNGIFITKLNGYWGMIDYSNNILIKNEYEKISPLYETYLLKKYGKYGLADKNGNIILPAEYEDIKKLDEYIIVKKDSKYGVLDSNGEIITKPIYKKIRLNRNNLEGKLKRDWMNIL